MNPTSKNISATIVDKASDKLRIAIVNAQKEIDSSNDPEIQSLRASELVLRKILAGGQEGQDLHDPNNSGDMLILTMASWD
jgi:hypothetical protein